MTKELSTQPDPCKRLGRIENYECRPERAHVTKEGRCAFMVRVCVQYATMTYYILHALANANARDKRYVRLVLNTIDRVLLDGVGKWYPVWGKRFLPGPCQDAGCSLWPLTQLMLTKLRLGFTRQQGCILGSFWSHVVFFRFVYLSF